MLRALEERARRRPDRQGQRRRRLRRAAGGRRADLKAARHLRRLLGRGRARPRWTACRRTPTDPFRALIPRYDLVLTYGGGEPVVDAYAALGARQCVPIYNALDPTTHYPVPPDPRFAADLGFLGNRLPDREARVEEFFLRAAPRLPGAVRSCSAAAAGTTRRCRAMSTTSATSTPPTTTPSTARRAPC